MPGILMPAACATFMGCTLGFMGGPAKPPLDAIPGSKRGFHLKSHRKVAASPRKKPNKLTKKSLSLPAGARPRPPPPEDLSLAGVSDLFGGLTDSGVPLRAPELGSRFDRKSPLSTKS